MSHEAIRNIHSNVVVINGDYPECQAWDADGNEVTLDIDRINTEINNLRNKWVSTEYQRLRKVDYPSIGDQLDALFHAGVFPPEMAAQIQAVKDKYPKGN